MKISKIVNSLNSTALAIRPERLETIHRLIEAKQQGTFEGSGDQRPGLSYMDIKDGIAIIHIHGTVGRRQSVLQYLFGGVSTETLLADIKQAVSDPQVKGILLHIDSPGGMVDGSKELADVIYSARSKKPIYAFAEGEMASAAYWLGSAAHKIFSEKTALIGSIGIVATHYDLSGYDEKLGVKRTYIYNGKFKRIANDAEPLSQEGRDYLQGIVDDYYKIFVEDVARNRSQLSQAGIRGMESKIFIADKAFSQGLIDGIGDYSYAYDRLSNEINAKTRSSTMAKSAKLITHLSPMGDISANEIQRPIVAKGPLAGLEGEALYRAEYEQDPELAKTYGSIESYIAYRRADSEGRIRRLKKSKEAKSKASIDAFDKSAHETAGIVGTSEDLYRAEYKQNPNLEKTYGSVEAYVAYKIADAEGRVKIAKKKIII